jgi:hypothetical protein
MTGIKKNMSSVSQYDRNFRLDSVKSENISDLKIFCVGDHVYFAWKEKSDNGIYLSVSIDSGKNKSAPKKVMDTNGNIRDLQIRARGEDFVIALIEKINDRDHKRAVSGWLNTEQKIFSFKPCTSHKINGELINMYLSFNNKESIDHLITKTDDGTLHEITMGHGCAVKDLKTIPITTVKLS